MSNYCNRESTTATWKELVVTSSLQQEDITGSMHETIVSHAIQLVYMFQKLYLISRSEKQLPWSEITNIINSLFYTL